MQSGPDTIPPPMKHPSFGKVTEDLHQRFFEGRDQFLHGEGVPWLEERLEGSLSPTGGRGIRYASEMDVENFPDCI